MSVCVEGKEEYREKIQQPTSVTDHYPLPLCGTALSLQKGLSFFVFESLPSTLRCPFTFEREAYAVAFGAKIV